MGPRPEMDPQERVLNSEQIARLHCTDQIRRSFSNKPGIVMDSEKVSQSDQFGYVYRYDLSEVLRDESGTDYTIRTVLVVWTTDCEMWEFATYPMFELPGSQAR